jgi:hypothetical protein
MIFKYTSLFISVFFSLQVFGQVLPITSICGNLIQIDQKADGENIKFVGTPPNPFVLNFLKSIISSHDKTNSYILSFEKDFSHEKIQFREVGEETIVSISPDIENYIVDPERMKRITERECNKNSNLTQKNVIVPAANAPAYQTIIRYLNSKRNKKRDEKICDSTKPKGISNDGNKIQSQRAHLEQLQKKMARYSGGIVGQIMREYGETERETLALVQKHNNPIASSRSSGGIIGELMQEYAQPKQTHPGIVSSPHISSIDEKFIGPNLQQSKRIKNDFLDESEIKIAAAPDWQGYKGLELSLPIQQSSEMKAILLEWNVGSTGLKTSHLCDLDKAKSDPESCLASSPDDQNLRLRHYFLNQYGNSEMTLTSVTVFKKDPGAGQLKGIEQSVRGGHSFSQHGIGSDPQMITFDTNKIVTSQVLGPNQYGSNQSIDIEIPVSNYENSTGYQVNFKIRSPTGAIVMAQVDSSLSYIDSGRFVYRMPIDAGSEAGEYLIESLEIITLHNLPNTSQLIDSNTGSGIKYNNINKHFTVLSHRSVASQL